MTATPPVPTDEQADLYQWAAAVLAELIADPIAPGLVQLARIRETPAPVRVTASDWWAVQTSDYGADVNAQVLGADESRTSLTVLCTSGACWIGPEDRPLSASTGLSLSGGGSVTLATRGGLQVLAGPAGTSLTIITEGTR